MKIAVAGTGYVGLVQCPCCSPSTMMCGQSILHCKARLHLINNREVTDRRQRNRRIFWQEKDLAPDSNDWMQKEAYAGC